MQLQKEKKHLQKTMQELELARKVELMSMLIKDFCSSGCVECLPFCSEDFKAGGLQKGECEGFCPWLCAWRAEKHFWDRFCF